jgi:hypothetical protein
MIVNFNIDALKLLGAALALVISTATAQFTIATFVNKVRDEFHEKRKGRWCFVSEIYDLLWGYSLGIVFNYVFLTAADIVRSQTVDTPYASFGSFLWWVFLGNFVAWIVGIVVDLVRVFFFPGEKNPAQCQSSQATVLTAEAERPKGC